jgi:hypothetical protein
MARRVYHALALLALAGCQSNRYHPDLWDSSYRNQNKPYQSSAVLAQSPAVTGSGSMTTMASTSMGGGYRETDLREGRIGFWNADLISRREIGLFPDRYAERVILKSGAVLTYEKLNSGAFVATGDAELIKQDLQSPEFARRGIAFDPGKIERAGQFTYFMQSSGNFHCFVFRSSSPRAGTRPMVSPVSTGGPAGAEEVFGNVCYDRLVKDVTSIKAEMLDTLSRLRLSEEPMESAAVQAMPAAAAVAASAEQPATASVGSCPYEVAFSGAPASPGSGTAPAGMEAVAELRYQKDAYSEGAACTCKNGTDYSKMSQFDAIDATRDQLDKKGFKLEKTGFNDTQDLGRVLEFEAVAHQAAGDTFLVGRTIYDRCGLSVMATGSSFSELEKGQKFVQSVAKKVEKPAVAVADADDESEGSDPGLATAENQDKDKDKFVDAEARLRRLKDLLKEKLITQSEYEAKRKAILEKL